MKQLPKVSYHGGHSGDLCAHASDDKESIISRYIANGFTQFAITEHVPPPNDALLYADEIALGLSANDLTAQFDTYFFEKVAKLKSAYANQAQILFGCELEFHSENPTTRVTEIITRYQPELVVASVHHVNNLPYDIKKDEFESVVSAVGGIDNFYQIYFDHQLELAQHLTHTTNVPIVIGHIDLPKIFAGPFEKHSPTWPLLERNISYFASKKIPIEVNTHGYKKGLNAPYPSEDILECIAQKGALITLGDDSHRVDEVGHFWKEAAEIIFRHFNSIATLDWQTKKWQETKL